MSQRPGKFRRWFMRSRRSVPSVVSVRVAHDHVLELEFSDGAVGQFDMAQRLDGPLFAALKHDYTLFSQVQVDPEIGTIVWPTGADWAPEVLYADMTPTSQST